MEKWGQTHHMSPRCGFVVGVGCKLTHMQTTLRSTLDTLRAQRDEVESEVESLRAQLSGSEQRLNHIRGAIEHIEPLVGEPSTDDDEKDDVEADEVSPPLDTPTPTPPAFPLEYSPVRTRVPSTEWIAAIVNEMGGVVTRDEVFAAFEERHGLPESWTNPRNSLGNAINRAADRGMIQRLDSRHFAPRGFDPSGPRDFPRTGGQ